MSEPEKKITEVPKEELEQVNGGTSQALNFAQGISQHEHEITVVDKTPGNGTTYLN